MKKHSAGLLLYRSRGERIEVLIAHMGGPWFGKKDEGAWTIPKGEYDPDSEEALKTAKREFSEELGKSPPEGDYQELGYIEQRNNKVVTAWAVEAYLDVSDTKSNTFTVEWPPGSGRKQEFPEIDRAEWVEISQAASRLVQGQAEFLKRLADKLGVLFPEPNSKPEQSSLF